MNPYIKVVDKSGNVTFMHTSDPDKDGTDAMFIGGNDNPKTLKVLVVGLDDGNSQEFTFSLNSIVMIISKALGEKTRDFLKEWIDSGKILEDLLDEKEVYSDLEDVGHDFIQAVDDGLYGENTGRYYFKLSEQPDDKWVLSVVFCFGEEVKSEPVDKLEIVYC
jgi:hypothetical protein